MSKVKLLLPFFCGEIMTSLSIRFRLLLNYSKIHPNQNLKFLDVIYLLFLTLDTAKSFFIFFIRNWQNENLARTTIDVFLRHRCGDENWFG
jgi:hypothetical protein